MNQRKVEFAQVATTLCQQFIKTKQQKCSPRQANLRFPTFFCRPHEVGNRSKAFLKHTLRFWGRTALQSQASPNRSRGVCVSPHNLSYRFLFSRVMSVTFLFFFFFNNFDVFFVIFMRHTTQFFFSLPLSKHSLAFIKPVPLSHPLFLYSGSIR